MLLSENHSADQSAFLDLWMSPSASILLFFLLFLLFSTHSNFYSNFFQNQIGRSYSCSQKLPSLTLLDLSLLDLCSSVQSKWHGNAKCTAKCTAPFFHGSWATIRGMVEVTTKHQALKTLWLNLSSNVKLCRNCLNDRQEAKHSSSKAVSFGNWFLIDQSFARTFSFCRDSSSLHRCNTLVKASEGMSVPGMCWMANPSAWAGPGCKHTSCQSGVCGWAP